MKSSLKGIILIVGMLLFINAACVYADTAPVQSIQVTGCNITVPSLVCSGTATVVCHVYDGNGGNPAAQINSVYVAVNGANVALSKVSGDFVNGTWSATLTQGQGVLAGLTTAQLTSVNVVDSTQSTCILNIPTGSQNPTQTPQSGGCYFGNFGNIYLSMNCTCTTTQTVVPHKDNTATVTLTPSAGCANQQVTTQTVSYDYCDPGFHAIYSACVVPSKVVYNENGTVIGTMANNDLYKLDSPLMGTATKYYISNDGGACCGLTNLSSDCVAPATVNNVACAQDLWSDAGGGSSGTGTTGVAGSVLTTNMTKIQATVSAATDSNVNTNHIFNTDQGYVFQPLVGDWQQTGATSTLVQTNGGFTIYDQTGSTITVNDGITWRGQGAIFGVNKYMSANGPKIAMTKEVASGSVGLGFAAIGSQSGIWYLFEYQYTVANGMALKKKITIPVNVASTGVTCLGEYCYYMNGDGKLYQINTTVTGGGYVQAEFDSNRSLNVVGDEHSSPALIVWPETNDCDMECQINHPTVVMKVFNAPSLAYVSDPAMALVDTNTGAWDFFTRLTINNDERAMSGPAVIGFKSDDSHYPGKYYAVVAFSSLDKDNLSTTSARLSVGNVMKTAYTSSAFWSGASEITPANIGQSADCISNPVSMACGGQSPGIGIVTHYVPLTSNTSTQSGSWQVKGMFDTKTLLSSPIDSVSTASASGQRALCSGTTCYILTGKPIMSSYYCPSGCPATGYGDSEQLYYSNNGGAWTQIAIPSTILNLSKRSTAAGCGGSYTTAYKGDTIVGVGMLNGNLYVLSTYYGTAGCGSFQNGNLNVWKYDGLSWTQLSSTPMNGWQLTDPYYKRFSCDDGNTCTAILNYLSNIGQLSYAGEVGNTGNGVGLMGVMTFNAAGVVSVTSPADIPATSYYNLTRNIYGYVKTSAAEYYALKTYTDSKNYVLRYPLSGPFQGQPQILDSWNDDTLHFVGLQKESGGDVVYWAAVPDGLSTACAQLNSSLPSRPSDWSTNLQSYTTNDNYYSQVTFGVGTQCNTINQTGNQYSTCTWRLKKSSNGGAASTVYSKDVSSIVTQGWFCWNGGSPNTVAGAGYTVAPNNMIVTGVDSSSSRYVGLTVNRPVADTSLYAFHGLGTTSSYVMLTKDGIYFPNVINVSNVSVSPTEGVGAGLCPVSSLLPMPGTVKGAVGCRPAAEASTAPYSRFFFPSYDGARSTTLRGITIAPQSTELLSVSGQVSSSASTQEFDILNCYVPQIGTVPRIVYTAQKLSSMCSPVLTTADIDKDGRGDFVLGDGVYRQDSGASIVSTGLLAQYGLSEVVDVNSDGNPDIITLTDTVLQQLMSNPGLYTIGQGQNLSVQSVSCSYDDPSKSLTVATFAQSAHPDNTYFQASYVTTPDVSGTVASGSDKNPVKYFSVSKSSTYNVSVIVTDASTGETAYGYCNPTLTVSQSACIGCELPTPSNEGCTLGLNNGDGGFNYMNSLSQHKWIVSGEGTSLTGSSVKFSNPVTLTHGVSCSQSSLTMEVKFRYASMLASGRADFMLMQDAGYTPVPTGYFYVNVSGGTLKLYANGRTEGPVVVYTSNDPTQWITVSVAVDRSTGTQTVSINGTAIAQMSTANVADGGFSVVQINGDVNLEVDQVNLINAGGGTVKVLNVSQENMLQAVVPLKSCKSAADLYNEVGYDPHANSAARNGSMTHIKQYCDILNGGCDYGALNAAVRINANCYSEAYQYCVQVVYPFEQGNADQFANGINTQQTGMDGASVCSTILMSTTVTNSVVAPVLRSIWTAIILPNWLIIAVVLLFVVLIAAVRRR